MQEQRRGCNGRGCNRRMGQFLNPVLLLLLAEAPSHGYPLLDRLPDFGLDELRPTVIYRALRDMEERGWVSSTWDEEETQGPARRVYALTPLGEQVLACCVRQLAFLQDVIRQLVDHYQTLSLSEAPERADTLS